MEADVIVVGSGCSGAMAAQTLLAKGLKVHLLDVGIKDTRYGNDIPEGNFEHIRQTNNQQHQLFLGKEFESLEMSESKSGAQLTPPRKHLTQFTNDFLRIQSSSFFPVESLAYGGLGAGWGLGCCVYSETELIKCGLDPATMQLAYDTIAQRIGISADATDNASAYTIGKVPHYLPPLELDETQFLLEKFNRKKEKFNQLDFFMGRPALALLSRDFNERKATQYDDMHFYHDTGNSAYRPGLTIDKLLRHSNFFMSSMQLVISFLEDENGVEVNCVHVETHEKTKFRARKLVLAVGALSSARIVVRSFSTSSKLSFLCNPYTYYPCLNPFMAGKKIMEKKTGMAQLSLFHDPENKHANIAMASLYSYRSLFLFRLLNEIPLNYKDSREIMRFLLSGIVIMGIHHPDEFNSNRFLLRKSKTDSITGDAFEMEFVLSKDEQRTLLAREKKFTSVMRQLGYWALKRVQPGMGASIHYAGTLPFSKEEKPFTLDKSGRLHGTKNVFVADSSGFTYLPAKGLTFSLMANAHRTAEQIF
jgi:GMC oxidoreductase